MIGRSLLKTLKISYPCLPTYRIDYFLIRSCSFNEFVPNLLSQSIRLIEILSNFKQLITFLHISMASLGVFEVDDYLEGGEGDGCCLVFYKTTL